ncbi:hypothetical protein DL240_10170 [Lujinxingia litoralis]|uniref:Uncharacterized protein n=1 Tax=Lujinxingia litoralis TaxID=2211119 RepID=A0A328C4M5_9DELT|nr:hypothetical protein DL240_10170 [Lujinxingia litoralis]
MRVALTPGLSPAMASTDRDRLAQCGRGMHQRGELVDREPVAHGQGQFHDGISGAGGRQASAQKMVGAAIADEFD